MKISLIIVSTMFILLVLPVYAVDDSSFEVVIGAKDLVINPGEEFPIDVYISGWWAVETQPSIKIAIYSKGDVQIRNVTFGDQLIRGNPYALVGGNIEKYIIPTTNYSGGEGHQKLNTELDDPIRLNAYTENNARSGDYPVIIVLTYGQDGNTQWRTTKAEQIFHVTSFFERWQLELTILGLMVTFIGGWFTERLFSKVIKNPPTKSQ